MEQASITNVVTTTISGFAGLFYVGFDVSMNLFIPAASVTWKSLRRVDVVWAVCMDTMDTAALYPKVHHPPKMFRVARRKKSGLAGLFLHEF